MSDAAGSVDTQHVIAFGDHRAAVTQVGATLRELHLDGSPVLDGFDPGQQAPDGRGQVLAPWPNRLAEGRYVFGGRTCQAPVNEPSRGTAIHGLVRSLEWSLVEQQDATVTLACGLRPQPGYEWPLDLEVSYRLDEDGLTVTARVVNTGTDTAPWGVGFHPYLSLGRPVDDLELRLPARQHVPAGDPDARPAPVSVAGTDLDFSRRRLVGATVLDTCFTGLDRGGDGRAVAVLAAPGATDGLQLWVDEGFPYLMVYTADQVGEPHRRRAAIAIEPMSCPPNAFRSGTDVVCLEPGAAWQAGWGLRAGQLPQEGIAS